MNHRRYLFITIAQYNSLFLIKKLKHMTDNALGTNNVEASNAGSQGTLFVPFLGQSNGQHMSIIRPPYKPGSTSNNTSGAIVLRNKLDELTNYNIVTSTSTDTNFSIGNSRVNGNSNSSQGDSQTWWYPDENRPGGALLAAERDLEQWLTDNGAQPTDEIAIVWSQGEADAETLDAENPQAVALYKQSTLAVFNYLKNSLDYENITFYIVPTGRLQTEAASNAGFSEERIASIEKGLIEVRRVQGEIAMAREDVHLAPGYSDLNMVYEEGQIYGDSYDVGSELWSKDFWHLGNDGLKINGNRIAQYIALDNGQNNVISFTDSLGDPAESIALSRRGLLDLDISGNNGRNIQGTDKPDVIVGTLGDDEITGKSGDDVIVATKGFDTLTGGTGDDVFFYADINAQTDLITDFEPGSDRLDLSEPLRLAGYEGSNPIADGYITVVPIGTRNIRIQFEGDEGRQNVALIADIDRTEFLDNLNEQFIFTPTEF